MKKTISSLMNRANCAAIAILGAITANAEVITNDLYDAVSTDVKVGYKITGLNDGKEEVVVFTKDSYDITWNVPANLENVEYLIVGGGGGGGKASGSGDRSGGGGGAGGFKEGHIDVTSGSALSISVGAGGQEGTSGVESSIIVDSTTLIAYGGGAGGWGYTSAKTGGSGGGGLAAKGAGGNAKVAGEGNVGGAGGIISGNNNVGGGGGGAGGAGVSGPKGGTGGAGKISSITGEEIYYAAGGGGGSRSNTYQALGGIGSNGGGYGGKGNSGGPAKNYGCGGGGSSYNSGKTGGAGYQGIVVLRYVENLAPEKPVVDNLTYTGSELVGVIGDGFTVVSGTVAATEVGTYTAVLSPEGGVWADGAEGNYEVTWKILPIMTGLDINENDGYIVRGLGDGNEVAVVFTNENADAINWTAPAALNNVEFLVVGGGGGGGADNWQKAATGGAGGGGGGVVTGLVNFAKNDNLFVSVGKGGEGGKIQVNNNGFGASYSGADSTFGVDDVIYVTAYGGGRDQGSNDSSQGYSNGNVGGNGGSGAGSRPEVMEISSATQGTANFVTCYKTFGNSGGKGSDDVSSYGAGASGGGGGAHPDPDLGKGGDAISRTSAGKGGEGFSSGITGVVNVYGSGGGGASIWGSGSALGGTGAGDGGYDAEGAYSGSNAEPNRGGGGGGSSRVAEKGGNGGSGIVVFRFAYSPVAAVNGYGYADIAAAINAANGGTVTLVANVESITLNNSLTLKTDVYSVNTVTIANENAVLTTDKQLNVISSVEDYEIVETVEGGVYTYSLEVVISTYTITLPEVTGAKWYYGDNAVVGNTITVESGTDVTLTLKADSGYVFENGEASITVNIGNVTADVVVNDSQYTAPSEKVASGKITSVMQAYSDGRERIGIEFKVSDVKDVSTLYLELYDEDMNVLIRTSYIGTGNNPGSCNIVLKGNPSGSWATEILTTLTIDNIPAVVKMFADGVCLATDVRPLSSLDKYLNFDCVLKEEPDAVVESGIWGGIDWTLSAKGVLTIAPTAGEPTQIANRPKTFVRGEWPEAVRYNTKGEGVEIAGWPYDRSKVKKLVIEEGVTKIGSFTAQGFNNLTGEVVIPWTVTYIGQEAFQRSQLTKLTFGKVPEGKIGEELCIAQGAFKNLEIEEATLPDDRPVHLHAWIFNNCHKLKRVTFPATIKSMHGTNHIDYFKNFESHSNPTWTKSSELLAYDESIEVVTFGSEEVKNMFFNINNGTSKDYIKAVVGLKAYGKLQLAIDAANAGDTIKLIKDITENITVNKPINFTGKTIKGEITIDSEANLIVKRDANGKIIGVVVPEAVMNSVKYAPVQEAIDAAQDGDVITLIADVTLTESLKVDEGKTIILDLNGHKITMDESLAATGYAIENSGTLTLIDSGKDSGSVQSRGILNNGTLYVENGTYNAVGDGSAIVNNGEAYLTGGTFTAESGYSLNNASGATMSIGSRMRRMFAGVVVANGIYSNGDLLINGGEIYDNSGRNAICVDGDNAANSSAVINGGTITGGLSVNEGAGLEIAGGVFNGDKAQNYDIKGNISIKGGAFLDDAAKSFAHDNVTLKDNEVLTVTDEVFANLLRSKKGYYVSQNANYSYSIMLKSSFRLFVTAVEGKPRLGFFQDHATGAKACTLFGATNLEKPDWTPVAYSEANDASNASEHPLKWVKINETKDSTKVYRFFKIAE